MHKLKYIDDATYRQAMSEPVVARAHAPLYAVEAPYIAEMARLDVRTRFGAAAESAGYKVYTTIDSRLQTAANRAVRIGLIEYDRRHGWRGPVGHAEIAGAAAAPKFEALLDEYSSVGVLSPAIVVSVAEKTAKVFVKSRGFAQVAGDGIGWARKEDGPAPKTAAEVVAAGDVVYVVTDGKGIAQIAQIPDAQSALVSMDPRDGAIAALVGGFDYFSNKYNRVTQARRLPGSGFKPFLYSAALENGFTPASVLLDAPIVLEGDGLETSWRPKNDGEHGEQFRGPTRLREALYRSRNLVSIRVLRALGRALRSTTSRASASTRRSCRTISRWRSAPCRRRRCNSPRVTPRLRTAAIASSPTISTVSKTPRVKWFTARSRRSCASCASSLRR
jgi:penicillin-binding protein 1A